MAGLIDILQELFSAATGPTATAGARVGGAPEVKPSRMTFGAGQVDPYFLQENDPGEPMRASGSMQAVTEKPEMRVPAGMSVDTRGPLPVSDALTRTLSDAYAPSRTASVVPDSARRASMPLGGPPPNMPQANPPAASNAITGQDVARFIRSVAMGAARVDPRSPAASAIAQGAAGSLSNSYGERQREEQIADARNRVLRQDELRAEREGRLLDKQVADGQRAERREARADALADTTKRLREQQLKRLTDPTLDNKDGIAIERLVRDRARDLRREIDAARMTEQAAQAELKLYREEMEKKFGQRQARGAAPAAPQPYTVDQYKPGQVIGGYRFKGGDPTDPNNYEKAGQ